MIEKDVYSKRAIDGKNNFYNGYNCSQSVVLAFADLVDIDKDTLLRAASCYGGGMGRLREICGTFSGVLLIEGLILGYSSPENKNAKAELYSKIQSLAKEFKQSNGSIICRELLNGIPHTDGGKPEERTAEYYKRRPCADLVAKAVQILEQHLKEQGIQT